MQNNYHQIKALLLLALLAISMQLRAQKSLEASKIEAQIKIDGHLDEDAWQNAESVANGFKTQRPQPGLEPAYPTEIKMLYDDDAIYISAYMKEGGRDSIMSQLVERDNIGNTDFIGVIIDTYGNSNSAFEFILSSTNVQFDAKVTPNNEDSNWDAVWFGAVQLNEDCWIAEIKIPFAAIRFPKQKIQEWNINFFRRRAINGEQSLWNDFDPEVSNPWLTQMGKLKGIQDIKPPVRLSFSPYASIYGINSHDKSREKVNVLGSSYNLGLDLKYGINDAYTLDMTLVPDFGQVQSDDVVLNLSPFEQRFAERRQFFTEGLEMFNKGNVFYSRRVGDDQQLYNATKISGRGKNGLGMGFFNAVAAEKTSDYIDPETQLEGKIIERPLTNYNIIVFDKDLKNNSSVSLTNTNVYRNGSTFHNANVTATTFNLKNKKQSYGVQGNANYSQLLHANSDNVNGHHIRLNVDKIDGAFIGGIGYQEISPNYNPNDLGFNLFTNMRTLDIYGNYRKFDGWWKFNQMNAWASTNYQQNTIPNKYSAARFNAGFWAQTKSLLNFNIWTNYNFASNDFWEPRTFGRYFQRPANGGGGYWFGTDNRKKFRFQSWGNGFKYNEAGWSTFTIGAAERYRASDKFTTYVDSYYAGNLNEKGFATFSGDDIILGKRDVKTLSSVLGATYTFNDLMGLDFRLRHYWSKVNYTEFFELQDNGSLDPSEYNQFHDFSYSAFAIDLNFNWRFAPGSEINITWKNNISGVNTDQITNFRTLNYGQDLRSLSQFPQVNSISMRIVYFLDYSTQIKPIIKR